MPKDTKILLDGEGEAGQSLLVWDAWLEVPERKVRK